MITKITEEEDMNNRIALLTMERDGYKNVNAILVQRIAHLESGDGSARIRELTEEITRLQQTNESLHQPLSSLAYDYEHGSRKQRDHTYYQRRISELEGTQEEILRLLGHGECDGSTSWDY